MTHGSLFSGIGGFDLAAQWMGWENKFHCEWNEFGQRVLKHYWPQAELFTDITKSDFTKYANKIDVLTGGFPCQPYSMAGKRLGKEDDRHLWPQMLRAIREIQPTWVVGENVLGIVNWNGGLVFEEVQADLEAEGYEVQPYVLPAAAVNAPHRRERIWFVAHTDGSTKKYNRRTNERTSNEIWRENSSNGSREFCSDGNASDTDNERLEGSTGKRIQTNEGRTKRLQNGIIARVGNQTNWQNFPTQSPICSGDDGLPTELDGITFSKWRNESIKAYGNAVVPQVVYQIFKAIEQYETTQRNTSNRNS